jgi:hypothetical protein
MQLLLLAVMSATQRSEAGQLGGSDGAATRTVDGSTDENLLGDERLIPSFHAITSLSQITMEQREHSVILYVVVKKMACFAKVEPVTKHAAQILAKGRIYSFG